MTNLKATVEYDRDQALESMTVTIDGVDEEVSVDSFSTHAAAVDARDRALEERGHRVRGSWVQELYVEDDEGPVVQARWSATVEPI